MITTYPYPELFLRNDVHKDMIITDGYVSIADGAFVYHDYTYLLTNDDLKSVPQITEMLTDGKSLDFGCSNSNYIDFSIAADVVPLIKKKCRVYMWLDNRVETLFKVGVYYITSDKATADRNYRNVTAYDKLNEMNKADVTDWYNSQFPNPDSRVTVGDFRRSFCRYFGLQDLTDTSEMVNDNVAFGKNISPNEGSFIDGQTILRAICSANGGFGNIDRDGNFRCICLVQSLIGLYPAIDLYPSEDLLPREEHTTIIEQSYYIPPLAYEDYYTENITKVCIKDDNDSIGVTVGEDGNDYILEGNFIFMGKDATELEEIATRLLHRITGLAYMPFDVRAHGNPIFEVGDAVRFRTGDVRVNSYILKRTLSGTSALEDQYSSTGDQYRDDKAGDLSSSVQKLVNKTAKLTKNIEGVTVELEDLENDVATEFRIQQGQINLKVSQGDVSSSLSVESGRVTLNSNRLVVNSDNFKLDENGNAEFSGTLKGAKIEAGSTLMAYDQYSSHFTAMSYAGFYLVDTSNNNRELISLNEDNFYLRSSLYSGCYAWIHTDSTGMSELILNNSNGQHLIINSNGGIGSGQSVLNLSGSGLTFNSLQVLTEMSNLDASKLQGTIASANLPSNLLTTSSTIQTSQINFGKRFTAHGTSNDYTMTLQTITIGTTRYVMYAEEQP